MRISERGNVFFYIFLAIALFGSLSYAVSQGSRGSIQNLSNEQSRLRATELISYGDSLANAVGTLRLRGTTAAQLSFANSGSVSYGTPGTNPVNEVFNSKGGGIIFQDPPADAVDGGSGGYEFAWKYAIQNIGTTCASPSCSDLLMIVSNIKNSVCLQINTLLGVTNLSASEPPMVSNTANITPYNGTISHTDIIGGEPSADALSEKTAACYYDDNEGMNRFYRVLWAQ